MENAAVMYYGREKDHRHDIVNVKRFISVALSNHLGPFFCFVDMTMIHPFIFFYSVQITLSFFFNRRYSFKTVCEPVKNSLVFPE